MKFKGIGSSFRWMIVAVALGLVTLAVVGTWFHAEQRRRYEENLVAHLTAIGELKTRHLVRWREDELSDAAILTTNSRFLRYTNALFAESPDFDPQAFTDFLSLYARTHEFHDIVILDAEGNERYSLSGLHEVHSVHRAALVAAMAEGAPVFSAFERESAEEPAHVSVVAPFRSDDPDGNFLGAVVLIIDAPEFLYPMVQQWPLMSDTAESLLLMRDGEEAVLLSEPRHGDGRSLETRIPLSRTEAAGVQAILGHEGYFVGRDYRGERVHAFLGPIKGSPWFIVTKIDRSEAMAGWHTLSRTILFLLVALGAVIIAAGFVEWQAYRITRFRLIGESEERYRQLFEESPISLWEEDLSGVKARVDDLMLSGRDETLHRLRTDRALHSELCAMIRVLDVNEATLKLFGVGSKEELIATMGFTHPEGALEVMSEEVAALAEGRTSFGSELELRTISGDPVHVALRTSIVPGHEHDWRRVIVSMVDITESKRAKQALERSNVRYDQLAEHSRTFTWEVDPDGLYTYIGHVAEAVIGYSVEEIVGKKHFYDLHPEEGREEFMREAFAIIREGNPITDFQNPIATKDGPIIWVSTDGFPLLDEAGNSIGYRGSDTDITQQRQAEEALQQSEAKYRFLTESIGDVIWTIDYETMRFTYVSPSATEMLGYVPHEVIDAPIELLMKADFAAQIRSLMARLVQKLLEAGDSNVPLHHSGEMALLRKDRATVVTETVMRLYRNPWTGRVELNGVTRDISRRRQLELERETLRNQLVQAQKLESIGRLAGGIAHDFNNMLGVILGNTEMAMMETEPGSEVMGDLIEIRKAAERSANLTRQLLAFARRQDIAPRVLDFNETVDGMIRMLQRMMGEDISVMWRPQPDLWPVRMDPSQIDQILANLCVNARDAIEDIGKVIIETANVTLDEMASAERVGFIPGDYIRLSFSDTGCGMDSDVLAKLFEPFFTTKEPGQGTGLGLSTVYGIVSQNGGFIEVTSKVGHGTTFEVYLPRYMGTTPVG